MIALPAVLAIALMPVALPAQSFTVSAEIVEGCSLSGSTAVTNLDFGTLAFGSHPAVMSGEISAAAVSGVNAVELECTQGMTLQVAVNGGQHANGGTRRMERGSTGTFVPYTLCSDVACSTPIPVSGTVATIVPASGRLTLPVYGRATLPGGGLYPGTYADTVQVTLSW